MERRFSFDEVASLYDATRPGYPDALFSDVSEACGLVPGDRVLEIGCGTGQATRSLAERGLRILALDPGHDLIRVARERLGALPHVEFAETTFEAWRPLPATFKLVIAAQSWHWVD